MGSPSLQVPPSNQDPTWQAGNILLDTSATAFALPQASKNMQAIKQEAGKLE